MTDNTAVSSSSSEKEMYQSQEITESHAQQVIYLCSYYNLLQSSTLFWLWQNDSSNLRDLSGNSSTLAIGNNFTVPCLQTNLFPMLSPPCTNSDRIAPNMVESDSLNETVSPLRPHTRRYCTMCSIKIFASLQLLF